MEMKIGEDLLEVYLGVSVKIWNVYVLYSAISSNLSERLVAHMHKDVCTRQNKKKDNGIN